MRRTHAVLALGAGVTAIAVLAMVDPALAQEATQERARQQAGVRFGEWLRGLVLPILFPLAGTIALAALWKRSWELAFTTIGLTIIIGSLLVPNTPWAGVPGDVIQAIL